MGPFSGMVHRTPLQPCGEAAMSRIRCKRILITDPGETSATLLDLHFSPMISSSCSQELLVLALRALYGDSVQVIVEARKTMNNKSPASGTFIHRCLSHSHYTKTNFVELTAIDSLVKPEDPAGTKKRITETLKIQRQTQFENLLLLSSCKSKIVLYRNNLLGASIIFITVLVDLLDSSALPCDRTFVLPLELLTRQTDVIVSALVAAFGHLLTNTESIITHAAENIDGSLLHSLKHVNYSTSSAAKKTPASSSLVPPSMSSAGAREMTSNVRRELKPYVPTPAKDLIHSHAMFIFERYFVQYRDLWPLFAPAKSYLDDKGMMEVPKSQDIPIPEWWPLGGWA